MLGNTFSNPTRFLLQSFLPLLLLVVAAFSEPRISIAIMTLKNGNGISLSESELISDRLRAEFFNTQSVHVMEREQMQSVLKEQGFQQSGACTDDACLVEMGKLLGVQLIIVGTIGKLGRLHMVNVRCVDVQTARIEMAVSEDVEGGIEEVVRYLPDIAQDVVESIAKPKPEPAIVGSISVTTTPSGAAIRLNGKVIGTAPFQIDNLAPGTYKVSADLKGYLSADKNVLIDKAEKKDVSLTLEKGAFLTIVSNKPGVSIRLDDSVRGTDSLSGLLVPAKTMQLKVSLKDCNDYVEKIMLAPGETRRIIAHLTSNYGILTVKTEPEKATIYLNKTRIAGTTPQVIGSIDPGNHMLLCELEGYDPITDEISVEKDALIEKSYTFSRSKAWLDSAKTATQSKTMRHKRLRNARRITFGTLAALSGAAGFIMDRQVQKSYDSYSRYKVLDQNAHNANWNDIESSKTGRNITYGAAGLCGALFTISIFF